MPCELAGTNNASVCLQGPIRAEVVLFCQIRSPGRGQRKMHMIETACLTAYNLHSNTDARQPEVTLEDSLLRPGSKSKYNRMRCTVHTIVVAQQCYMQSYVQTHRENHSNVHSATRFLLCSLEDSLPRPGARSN